MRYEEGSKFVIKGTSTSMASVFGFVTNLEKSKKFANVKTKYVTNRNERGVDVADFEIECLINIEGAP
jgi:Tfp pilus assembly protein PilN